MKVFCRKEKRSILNSGYGLVFLRPGANGSGRFPWRKPLALFSLAIVLAVPGRAAANDIRVDASANRQQIYIGESVLLTVKVSGMESPPDPEIPALEGVDVRLLGSRGQSFRSMSIVNGRRTVTESIDRIFTYELTPSRIGTFTVGPVSVAVGGKRISAPGPVIRVEDIEKQDTVRIRITSSRDTVLMDEPFNITLAVRLKRLKGQYAASTPLDPNDPPLLTSAFLNDTPVPGLESPDIRSLLRQFEVFGRNGQGFSINNYGPTRDPRSMDDFFDMDSFFQQRRAKFLFERSIVETNGASYFEYALTFRYVPKEEGNYTFGPAVFQGNVVHDVGRDGRAEMKRIFAVGPACTVRVVPPPEAGRPASYIGAIGTDLKVEAFLDAQTCNVGDPLTLTLVVSGNVRLDKVRAPSLAGRPGLTDNFRIYEDTAQTVIKENRKEFSYTIRPTRAGTLEVPPVEVSYYDTQAREYRTVKTAPLPLRANEAIQVGSDFIIETGDRTGKSEGEVRDDFVMAPIRTDASGIEDVPLTGGGWILVVLAVGPLLYAGFMALDFLRRRRLAQTEKRKRHFAGTRAIHKIKSLERSAPGTEQSRALYDGLKLYIADRFDAEMPGMTPADAARILSGAIHDPVLVSRFTSLLERHFNAAFGHAALNDWDFAADRDAAVKLIRETEEAVKTEVRSQDSES